MQIVDNDHGGAPFKGANMKKYRVVLLYPYGRIELTEFAESKDQALAQIEARLIFCLDEYAVAIYEPKEGAEK